jgi:hypothetical protein
MMTPTDHAWLSADSDPVAFNFGWWYSFSQCLGLLIFGEGESGASPRADLGLRAGVGCDCYAWPRALDFAGRTDSNVNVAMPPATLRPVLPSRLSG